MSFELFIGRRYLRAKQRQAFISLITILSIAGVTVGVMALIIVIAVMTGASADIKSRILGVEPHILLMRHDNAFADYAAVLNQVQTISDVEAAAPFIYTQVMLRSNAGVSGAVLRGVSPAKAVQKIDQLDLSLLKKSPPSKAESEAAAIPTIVLGKQLADNLLVSAGDPVYLITTKGMLSPIGHIPSMRRFQVAGTFESGIYEYDSGVAYIHLNDAQKILRMGDRVTGIELRVKDIYKANEVKNVIVSQLGFPYWARDWMQMNRNLFSALKLEKTALFIILTLIILVAAFNIASSLIMMVMEKKKDIAILKAMGATDRSIGKIFVFKGMVIGTIGTGLGVILGIIMCALLKRYEFIQLPDDVYAFTTLPVKLELVDVLVIAGAALLICFLSTLYPSRQASKLDPVEAIRYG